MAGLRENGHSFVERAWGKGRRHRDCQDHGIDPTYVIADNSRCLLNISILLFIILSKIIGIIDFLVNYSLTQSAKEYAVGTAPSINSFIQSFSASISHWSLFEIVTYRNETCCEDHDEEAYRHHNDSGSQREDSSRIKFPSSPLMGISSPHSAIAIITIFIYSSEPPSLSIGPFKQDNTYDCLEYEII